MNSDNTYSSDKLVEKISWAVMVLVGVLITFHQNLQEIFNLPAEFRWIPEIFISIVLVLAVFLSFQRTKITRAQFHVLGVIFLFSCAGILSGIYNQNRAIVTLNGIFDYVKNFLLIGVLGFFYIQKDKIRSLYGILHKVSVLAAVTALIQALLYYAGAVDVYLVRFGIPRASSFIGHPNSLGLYCLLFFFLDYCIHGRFRKWSLFLAAGVIISVSRMVWVAFGIGLFYIYLAGKKNASFMLFLLLFGVLLILTVPEFFSYTREETGGTQYFRGYALAKSLEIWNDSPVLGAGPGMYGGVVSFVFPSPVYEKYDFSKHWYNYMATFRSIDQFWAQILAEMGVVGFIIFPCFLLLLWKVSHEGAKREQDVFIRGMFKGLSVIPLVIFIYLFGSGLNLVSFLLTYSFFLGMCLSARGRKRADENTLN